MQAESCPKGIVDLQHDMVYTAASYAAHVLGLRPDDICFVAAGASSVLFPGRPEPAAVRQGVMWVRGHSSAPLCWNRPDKTRDDAVIGSIPATGLCATATASLFQGRA